MRGRRQYTNKQKKSFNKKQSEYRANANNDIFIKLRPKRKKLTCKIDLFVTAYRFGCIIRTRPLAHVCVYIRVAFASFAHPLLKPHFMLPSAS